MTRLFALSLTVATLALFSACNGFHWLTPIPPLPSVEPDLNPKGYPAYLPTITPEPSSYPCARWHVRECQLSFEASEL